MIEAVGEVVGQILGVNFAEVYHAYQQANPELELTEADLAAEILEAGKYQAEPAAAFEDRVMIGAIAIAGPLGLI